ncbi:FCD domain-containing protein [Agrobacterium vitis]|uniref:GntR family transcriptional regulator n=1 Tax=Agrobacterium vitis TaxID=373 RepID=UPI000871B830|nr:GntR family transcriptional regulator [Agrobacterium vitis]MCE6075627.1 FCD domain-containing protein [Agrobacterium vitis]MCF1452899.1 GntR family transcriptional regulator [Agrobacterium vitis]MCF1465497.1 GntR family transcriptional regulator [Agrobacterium vitis]MCM2450167.1 GntR family transcriptional regulator [Agrobacterium vitis]MCM2468105.1 GntR family transcriptional regulator [Agrobacterium vitis]
MNQPRVRELVRAGNTVEQLVRAIADLIIVGDLKPDDKLDEGSLAARFEVSRTPVREALRQLCAMGLVERKPNKSAVVTNVTGGFLTSMFEAMAELEGMCARLAAERMTLEERRALERMHRDSIRIVQAGQTEDYSAYNIEFHNRIYQGAHNQHILELVTQTRSRLAPFRRAQFRLTGRLSLSFQEHEAIVNAILRGEKTAAAEAAYRHVEIVGDASSTLTQHTVGRD